MVGGRSKYPTLVLDVLTLQINNAVVFGIFNQLLSSTTLL